MAPNLFLAARTACKPKEWFKSKSQSPSKDDEAETTEYWMLPVPGQYKHIPGRGWYLVATCEGGVRYAEPLETPRRVTYSRVLHEYLFDEDWRSRRREGQFLDKRSADYVGFFRVDDMAYVQCWDKNGVFMPGPYEQFVFDKRTGKFRPMLKSDDIKRKQRSAASSEASSRNNSQPGSAAPSRPSSTRNLSEPSISLERRMTASTVSTRTSSIWDEDLGQGRAYSTGATTPFTGASTPACRNDARCSIGSALDSRFPGARPKMATVTK